MCNGLPSTEPDGYVDYVEGETCVLALGTVRIEFLVREFDALVRSVASVRVLHQRSGPMWL